MEEKDLIKLIDKRLAKGLKERLAPIAKEVTENKTKIKGYDLQFKAFATADEDINKRLDGCLQYFEAAKARKGADEFKGIVDAIKGLPAEIAKLIQAKPVKPSGSMEIDVNLDPIAWKTKSGGIAGPNALWAWAFGYDQQGNLLPETKDLIAAIQQYGKIKVDDYTITLGGRDKKLLNRKKG